MTYYKLIKDGRIIDAGLTWLKYQSKHGILIGCEPNEAQFVQTFDGSTIYRVGWLNPAPAEAGEYETIDAAIITRQEYLDLRAVLDDGETPQEPEAEQTPEQPTEETPPEEQTPEERPMTVQQMRDVIRDQQEQIAMLTECILEMSEVVYGE